jgi:glycolate oxidase FAD binding subunit
MDRPETIEAAAAAIREHASAGHPLRPRGAGTKLGWCPQSAQPATDIDTRGLNRIVEHNAGDFTAVLEAGVSLQEAQAVFGRAGQMLALDPPPGENDAATIGGILASNDSGPLRHRYGSMRDLVIGITVVLCDGVVAASGGKVIKNVAGYDLAKLFTGSFGTLGMVARVALRLHPLARNSATLMGTSSDPEKLGATALALARLPLEADCLDVSWTDGSGRVLVRFAGATAEARARAAAAHMTALDEPTVVTDDAQIWSEQRLLQRAPDGFFIKVSGRPTDLPNVIRAAKAAGGGVVSRAGLGLSWIVLPAPTRIAAIRDALKPRACTVQDGAARIDRPWPALEPAALDLMQRVKMRFDPAGAFNPGIFVGGI